MPQIDPSAWQGWFRVYPAADWVLLCTAATKVLCWELLLDDPAVRAAWPRAETRGMKKGERPCLT